MDKRFRHGAPLLGIRRSSDVVSLMLICIACMLFVHSSNLRSSIDQIASSAPSSPGAEVAAPVSALGEREEAGQREAATAAHERLDRRLPAPMNRTGEAQDQALLVFTKIARSGGGALGHVLHGLARDGRFTVWNENPYRSHKMLPSSPARAMRAVQEMSGVSKPAVVMKQISHLNFSAYGFNKPIYVSMVRHPIEHAHSWFYWLRAPYAVVERALSFGKEEAVNHLPKATFLKKSFEACVESGDPECTYLPGTERVGHPMQAFCTSSPQCWSFGSRAALQEAKRVVESEYAVVGLLEDWDTSLTVMEKLVPRFFAGASVLYREKVAANRTQRNENFYKPKLSEAIRQKMTKNFHTEIEFYQFVKRRLYKQYESLKG
ncbi:heparan sulfate 2-O-sulfotransferase pipe-like [Pollicipes pollicipes]|uniref:heparan sulfate 2-O-sulfotransferase pipe-like n=1 Tax=Pollicipes pollicipes TaxID=41117 RepID=UPI0018850618|nr:heparan sulfate 2-O-sulfotransferase pipe-like [Pollicipes pollicipes]